MSDLKDTRLIYLKAALFLMIGLITSSLLLMERPEWKTALLLAITIWSFARCYYFAFYVIENYVDSRYRFAGLLDFTLYFLRGPREENHKPKNEA